MHRKAIALLTLITILIISVAFVFSPRPDSTENRTCRESMEDCRKQEATPPGNFLMESLSRQFLSAFK